MINSDLVDMRVTRNFRLHEFLESEAAQRNGWNNDPTPEVLETLLTTTIPRMQEVRDLLNFPVHITSGYRSLQVNRAVGGKNDSHHLQGWAVDFKCYRFPSTLHLAYYLRNNFQRLPTPYYDQLIYEFDWIHLSFHPKARMQILTIQPGQRTAVAGLPNLN